jgi:serine/threonine-protein kinase
MLQGEYEGSARSLQQALRVQPDNSSALLNLADCKALLGQRDSANAIYAKVQQQLARGEDRGTPANQLLRAQCLAHLGQMSEAVSLAQEALRSSGDDPDARFQAALVFALAGERTSCVVNTAAAMTHGMQARWFGLPWFDPLRKDAEFLKALGDSTKTAGT